MEQVKPHQIHYIKNRKEKDTDMCNICGEIKKLSWDHVPPKGSIFFDSVEIKSIFNKNSNWKGGNIFSQNGTKFRTICHMCNNVLGSKYDVEYNQFIYNATILISENYNLNEKIQIECKPNKLFKSIIGHLLAAKVDYEETTHDEFMRDLFLSNDLKKSKLNIFYWFYPFSEIIVIRDFLRGDFSVKNSQDFFSVLKAYPIGFYITEKNKIEDFHKLNDFFTENDEEVINLPLNISKIYDPEWPHIVDKYSFMMGGQSNKSAIISKPKKNIP